MSERQPKSQISPNNSLNEKRSFFFLRRKPKQIKQDSPPRVPIPIQEDNTSEVSSLPQETPEQTNEATPFNFIPRLSPLTPSLEGAGQNVFAQTNNPAGRRTMPNRPPGMPTQEEADAVNHRNYPPDNKNGWSGKVIRGGAAVALGAAGGYVGGSNQAIHETIDSLPGNAAEYFKSLFSSQPETSFSNDDEKGVYGTGNIVEKSEEEVRALPKVDNEGKPLFLFPLELRKEETVQYRKQGIDKDGKILYGSITLDEVEEGLEFLSPYDAYVFKSISSHNGGDPRVSSIIVIFETENKDVYVMGILNSHIGTSLFGLQTLDESIPSTDQMNHFSEFKRGKKVKRGERIAVASENLSNVDIQIARFIDGNFDDLKFRTTADINFIVENDKLVMKKDIQSEQTKITITQ